MLDQTIHLLGAVSGIAAGDAGCAAGPEHLKHSPYLAELPLSFQWHPFFHAEGKVSAMAALPQVRDLCKQIAQVTYQLTREQAAFTLFGGDHACAMGTWSGVAAALAGPMGLVWIDAHMDSHTPETSETGNIHGMPLAALMGQGHPDLTGLLTASPKIAPEHVCLIGIRSYESGEKALLERLGVRIYYIDEVKQRGFDVVLQEALTRVKRHTVGYGVSLDLDGIEPYDAPAVGLPVSDGIEAADLLRALPLLHQDPSLLGLEVVEFNPYLDKAQKTERLIQQILASVYLPQHTILQADQCLQSVL